MEKAKDIGSVAKEHVEIFKAKLEEKAETGLSKTKEEKKIAHELRKAKEHKAKKEMHEAKARHAAEKLHAKQAVHGTYGVHHHGTQPVVAGGGPTVGNPYPGGHKDGGAVAPVTGPTGPPYPVNRL